jgi:hypothetical protein
MLHSYCLSSHTLQQMIKMSSTRLNALREISTLAVLHPLEGPGGGCERPDRHKNALVKGFFLSFSIAAEYTSVFMCPPQIKTQTTAVWRTFADLFTDTNFSPRFQASAAMLTTSALFWDITQRLVVILHRRFGTTSHSPLQGSRCLFGLPGPLFYQNPENVSVTC